MIIITDLLQAPFDEGAKNSAFNLINAISLNKGHDIVSLQNDLNIDADIGIDLKIENTNKSFLDIRFLFRIHSLCQKNILYIPESSSTLFSLFRAFVLKSFTRKNIVIFAFQPRRYNGIKKIVFKLFAPSLILTPSKSYADSLHEFGVQCKVVPLGVNTEKYRQYEQWLREKNRIKYKIHKGKVTLLHVGHICPSRNLEWLLEVKREAPNIEIIVVGSSYNDNHSELYTLLKANGIRIVDQYIADMAEIYNLADYYIFPVIDDQGAIATPLSVLEAMSCNIPILTTKFGSLVDMFQSDKYFHFIDKSSDILETIKTDKYKLEYCNNRGKAEKYTWNCISDRVQLIMKGLE
jgi:glycosyltransferase involved in cell wall biosynthesis